MTMTIKMHQSKINEMREQKKWSQVLGGFLVIHSLIPIGDVTYIKMMFYFSPWKTEFKFKTFNKLIKQKKCSLIFSVAALNRPANHLKTVILTNKILPWTLTSFDTRKENCIKLKMIKSVNSFLVIFILYFIKIKR